MGTYATVFDLPTTGSSTDLHNTLGYYQEGDGGAGTYRYLGVSGYQQNAGTVIKRQSGLNTAYWGLIHQGQVSVKQFGAVGDGTAHKFDDALNGHRWYTSLSELQSYYNTGSNGVAGPGYALELAEAGTHGDTVDWVALNVAIAVGMRDGFKVTVPPGTYVVRKPVWYGFGQDADIIQTVDGITSRSNLWNYPETNGFALEGLGDLSRQEGDSKPSASIKLLNDQTDIENRFTLRLVEPDDSGHPVSNTAKFRLQAMWGDYSVSDQIAANKTASEIQAILEGMSDIGSGKVP